jgi:hypothetical protein
VDNRSLISFPAFSLRGGLSQHRAGDIGVQLQEHDRRCASQRHQAPAQREQRAKDDYDRSARPARRPARLKQVAARATVDLTTSLALSATMAATSIESPPEPESQPFKMSLPTGTRLGKYEIVAAVSAGGMGEVYRAIYDVGETPEQQMFIVMEFLQGETLQERLRKGRLERAGALARRAV